MLPLVTNRREPVSGLLEETCGLLRGCAECVDALVWDALTFVGEVHPS